MSLRDLPAVDRLLQMDQAAHLVDVFGRELTVSAIRECLDEVRLSVKQGEDIPDGKAVLERARTTLETWIKPTLKPLINGTGVVIHTNLGRAPLSQAASDAMLNVALGYSSLEYDLASGRRGKREVHAESLLARLTGAEAALVVNNNASAVLLALTSLAKRREVLVSRSQLIEIGGGFRIPDVMKQSGAKLVEVGTTNRTHLQDFEAAIHERTGLILRAHHSNFKIIGFTAEPLVSELVSLGNKHGVPVLDDVGSGALLETADFGLGHEPTVQESLNAGASLVAFSGDKLLGGPQAGILVGKKDLIHRMRKHAIARAVRADKLCLAALAATLVHYLKGEATSQVPVWRMISTTEEVLRSRSEAWARALGRGEVTPARSTVGGGSLPEETLPTWVLAIDVRHPNAFAARLRRAENAIVARVEKDKVLIDPRTVLPEQEDLLLRGLKQVLAGAT